MVDALFFLLVILWFWKVAWPDRKQKKSVLQGGKKEGIPQLMLSKAAYVGELLSWCRQHLGVPASGSRAPILTIFYYPHQKRQEVYYSVGKSIRIYVNNHPSVAHLTDTILHEYIHFLEIRNNAHQKEYDQQIALVGYENNPYELTARRKAAAHVRACIGEMKSPGHIR